MILFLMGCAIMMLGSAQGTNVSCTSSACSNVFASEFDESKIACNSSDAATECRCKFEVLDLAACVLNSNGGLEDNFNLMVTEIVGNVSSSKYTASCRDAVEQHGPCKLEGIRDHGFKITASEVALTSAGVGFEIMSVYQMVLLRLFLFSTCATHCSCQL